MHLSYWELKNWFANVDFTIVGSGIVGLHAALRLRENFPSSKILVLEKGMLPQGASTKNAGFACFGSLSEIVEDLKSHTEAEVFELIRMRWQGLNLLRNRLGDGAIDFQQNGGWEMFHDTNLFEECLSKITEVNKMLQPIFKSDVFATAENPYRFANVGKTMIFNPFEGQIDTGNMMQSLLKAAVAENILILNCQTVTSYDENDGSVTITTNDVSFQTRKLLFATNGFAKDLVNADVQPARAQVLITEPIFGLDIKGTFHFDKGYYYFRNIGERILFGGGRNLDFENENTSEFGNTELIQNKLEQLLKEVILPDREFKIAHRWSGIMGLGPQKNPIVRQLSNHVYCGVRLGGMGVAIGSIVGKELADLV